MAFGGRQYSLSAPGLLGSAQELEALRGQREVAHIFSLFQNISLSVSGKVPSTPGPLPRSLVCHTSPRGNTRRSLSINLMGT